MKTDAKSDIIIMVANMYKACGGSPFPRSEVAIKGPIAVPMNLAELRKPIAVPFRPDFPPIRLGGIPACIEPIAILRAMN